MMMVGGVCCVYQKPNFQMWANHSRQSNTSWMNHTQIIYLGESVLANELLAKTHGHEVGWVWVALGFGMVGVSVVPVPPARHPSPPVVLLQQAFGVPITLFNFCTAYFNPAMLTARWILGDINGVTWITLFVCEFVGGFLGMLGGWGSMYI